MRHDLLTPAAVHVVVWERQGGRCAACWGGMQPDAVHAHHRMRRRDLGWCACNVVGLHPGCHVSGPLAVHEHPEQAVAVGLIVPSWVEDVPAAPVWVEWPWRAWSVLTCDGHVAQAPEGALLPDGGVAD